MSITHPRAVAAPSSDRLNTLSIAGFVLAFVANIVGLVVSVIALAQIRRTGERGRGLAIAGVVVGGFWFALFAVVLVVRAVTMLHGA
jgi:vacuolar-type H+-ATPase subunit I/STV1